MSIRTKPSWLPATRAIDRRFSWHSSRPIPSPSWESLTETLQGRLPEADPFDCCQIVAGCGPSAIHGVNVLAEMVQSVSKAVSIKLAHGDQHLLDRFAADEPPREAMGTAHPVLRDGLLERLTVGKR